MAACSLSSDFAFDAVFLLCEGECNVIGLEEICKRCAEGFVDTVTLAEDDVAVPEGFRFVFLSGVAVFSRSHEEVKCDPQHVGNAFLIVVAADSVCVDVVKDLSWDWFDPRRRRVCAVVRAKLAVKAEVCFSGAVMAGIVGPQCSDCLSPGANVVFSGAFFDREAVRGTSSGADLMRKDL